MPETCDHDTSIVTIVKVFMNFIQENWKDVLSRLSKQEHQMAKLTEVQAKQAEAIAAVQAAVARVVEDNTAQNVEIQRLKDQIAAGEPVTEADLDGLVASNQTIIDTMNALDPIPPIVPVP